MNAAAPKFSAAIAILYTWMVTAFFGFVLLDILYARDAPQGTSESSDFLLLVGSLTFLAALGAAALSRQTRVAMLFFLLSLVLLLPEFVLPALLHSILQNPQGLAWLRPLPSGIASILAFIGLYCLFELRPAAPESAGPGAGENPKLDEKN